MTLVEGEELQRLWTLVSELSSQLSANQQLCQSLQAQADELKGQALHSGTGYTLRRFNLDISKEKFESELERINSQLVAENQALAHENKQMNILLREYESALETIMSKFRSFSHATQQHTLSLTSHYESLLANNAYEVANADLHANTAFSEHLTHLGSLVRLALRDIEGEGVDVDEDEDKDADPFEAEGYRVGSPSGVGPSHSIKAAIASATHATSGASEGNALSASKTKKSKQAYGSADNRDPRWHGTGGYTGFQGDPDAEAANLAMERRIEEEKLRKENEILRELLRVSADLTPEVAQQFDLPMPQLLHNGAAGGWGSGVSASKLSLGKPRGSRKSLGDAPVSGTADRPASEGEGASRSTGVEEGEEEEEEEEEDDEEVENKDDGSRYVHSDQPVAYTISSSSGQVSNASGSGIRSGPEHVTQGAGGPPQLPQGESWQVVEGNTQPNSGVLVTSDIADELDAQRREDKSEAEATTLAETTTKQGMEASESEALGLRSMTAAGADAEPMPDRDEVGADTAQIEGVQTANTKEQDHLAGPEPAALSEGGKADIDGSSEKGRDVNDVAGPP